MCWVESNFRCNMQPQKNTIMVCLPHSKLQVVPSINFSYFFPQQRSTMTLFVAIFFFYFKLKYVKVLLFFWIFCYCFSRSKKHNERSCFGCKWRLLCWSSRSLAHYFALGAFYLFLCLLKTNRRKFNYIFVSHFDLFVEYKLSINIKGIHNL